MSAKQFPEIPGGELTPRDLAAKTWDRPSKSGILVRGERTVGPGGRIYVGGRRLRDDKLKPWIGTKVFVRVDPRSPTHLIISRVDRPAMIICRAEVFLRRTSWYMKSRGFKGEKK